MQELIEWAEFYENEPIRPIILKHQMKLSLEKEKEQIIDAMERTAMYVSVASIDKEIGKMTIEDLYNQTYNNEKD